MSSKYQTNLNLDYYSVKGLADRIGYNPDTVYDWVATRGLPVRRAGKRCRITIYWPDFLKWWKANG